MCADCGGGVFRGEIGIQGSRRDEQVPGSLDGGLEGTPLAGRQGMSGRSAPFVSGGACQPYGSILILAFETVFVAELNDYVSLHSDMW